MAEAGVNIEVIYSDHDHQLILVVDDMAKGRAVSETWMRELEVPPSGTIEFAACPKQRGSGRQEGQMVKEHAYAVRVEWTGNDGSGTKTYQGYRRDHVIASLGKQPIQGSSDPSFRGDRTRYNPEELLVASLSSCHMLWYLHLCSVNHVTVLEYQDRASGVMAEGADGSGEFTRVLLRPVVKISAGDDPAKALALHEEAHRLCYIARSVTFPVEIAAEILEAVVTE
jgi:organic hydroperoxide reductase OsmC/OhrA